MALYVLIEAVHHYYEANRQSLVTKDKKPGRQEQVKRNKQATKHYLRKNKCATHCSNIDLRYYIIYIYFIIQLYLYYTKLNLHICATVANMMYIMLSIYNLFVHHSEYVVT